MSKNLEEERINNKLKLWETPGFSQFLNDLEQYIGDCNIVSSSQSLKIFYLKRINELKEEEGKRYKQLKLIE